MKRLLLFLLLLLCGHTIWAQTRDWSTIRENDTPYFAGGIYSTRLNRFGLGYRISGKLMRRIIVDSVRQSGIAKTVFFPKVIRALDTPAQPPGSSYARLQAGWQGAFCRQSGDSIDAFFNYRGDTIRILIRAVTGVSWVLTTDSLDREIRATVTAVGTQWLNNGSDSFREATLQAYQNNVPVAHDYNGRKLRWSKTKGWIKTLDWFIFPYGRLRFSNYRGVGGAKEDSSTYLRIDDSVNLQKGRLITDIAGRYAVGTASRTYWEGINPNGGLSHYVYRYDSVIQMSIAGNACRLQLFRSSCDFRLYPPTGATNPSPYWVVTPQAGALYADTIYADTAVLEKRKWILPDELTVNQGTAEGWNFLLSDTLCGKQRIVAELDLIVAAVANQPGLYVFDTNPQTNYYRTAAGMENTDSLYTFSWLGMTPRLYYSRLDYLKTPSCTFGSYVNVPSLSVGNFSSSFAATISPNPATDKVEISFPENLSGTVLYLTDISGKTLLKQPFPGTKATLSVATLPAGLYLIRLSGKDFAQTHKLVISR